MPDVKRLKALEGENGKLKKLLAKQMLDVAAMKELLAKKVVGSVVKREAVAGDDGGAAGAAAYLLKLDPRDVPRMRI